jgi:hypothetical protein
MKAEGSHGYQLVKSMSEVWEYYQSLPLDDLFRNEGILVFSVFLNPVEMIKDGMWWDRVRDLGMDVSVRFGGTNAIVTAREENFLALMEDIANGNDEDYSLILLFAKLPEEAKGFGSVFTPDRDGNVEIVAGLIPMPQKRLKRRLVTRLLERLEEMSGKTARAVVYVCGDGTYLVRFVVPFSYVDYVLSVSGVAYVGTIEESPFLLEYGYPEEGEERVKVVHEPPGEKCIKVYKYSLAE